MKILFCVTIFFGLLNAIATNEDVFENMSLEEKRSFSGTEDESNPECEDVEIVRSLRSKRSWKPSVNITFYAFGNPVTSTLHVVEDNDLIDRRHTGLWVAKFNMAAHQNVSYSPWPEAFDDIENFEFFQNVEEGSALTRFWDSNGKENYVGIIGHSYSVQSVQRERRNSSTNINRRYIVENNFENSTDDQDTKRLFLTVCKNVGVQQEYFRRHNYAENDADPNLNLHRPRRQSTNATKVPNVVHPKLLIIPDFNIVNRYRFYRHFIMQLIVQLNSVDVMFRQLKDPEVHLNIAGIILPWDNKTTPYISNHIDANKRVNGEDAVHEAEINFRNEKRRFPTDEWDTILILTASTIGSYNGIDGDLATVNSFSPIARGCSGAAVIARFTEDIKGIYTLAHGLGHMFGVKHDGDKVAAKQCTNADGYLMAPGYNYSQKVEWSNCSRAAFQTYFRSNEGKCTYSELKEIPDAINSMQGPWLPIDGQCDNQFNDSTSYCMCISRHIRKVQKENLSSILKLWHNCPVIGEPLKRVAAGVSNWRKR